MTRLALLLIALLTALSSAADVTVSCTLPTMRVDRTPMTAAQILSVDLYGLDGSGKSMGKAALSKSPCGGIANIAGATQYAMTATDTAGTESSLSAAVKPATPPPVDPPKPKTAPTPVAMLQAVISFSQQGPVYSFSCVLPTKRTDGTAITAGEIATVNLHLVDKKGVIAGRVATLAKAPCGGTLQATTGARRYVYTTTDTDGRESGVSNTVLATAYSPTAARVESGVTAP